MGHIVRARTIVFPVPSCNRSFMSVFDFRQIERSLLALVGGGESLMERRGALSSAVICSHRPRLRCMCLVTEPWVHNAVFGIPVWFALLLGALKPPTTYKTRDALKEDKEQKLLRCISAMTSGKCIVSSYLVQVNLTLNTTIINPVYKAPTDHHQWNSPTF